MRCRYDPEQTREIQDFDRTVASARGDGADEGAACMTDDDLVMQTGVDDVAANKACPITMTAVRLYSTQTHPNAVASLYTCSLVHCWRSGCRQHSAARI